MRFVVLTGEYPPDPGGVADYTWQVAQGLRKRGATVEVIVFRNPRGSAQDGIHFVGRARNPASLKRASRIIREGDQGCVLLVQYVPQMYGLKGMNLGWVLWLCRLKANPVWVMFHEVEVSAANGESWKLRLLASITHNMAQRLARRADRCFASICPFVELVEKLTRAEVRPEWLPVPSNLAVEADRKQVYRLRAGLLEAGAAPLVGHFGTFKGSLRDLMYGLVDQSRRIHPDWKFVFIGRGSLEFLSDLESQGVLAPGRAAATGELGATEAACWIKACDVMVQPYPDGASSRRTTLMAALALGKATVSNLGHSSDRLWEQTRALYLSRGADTHQLVAAVSEVLNDGDLRIRLQAEAALCYAQQFSLEHTIQKLEMVAGAARGRYVDQRAAAAAPFL